MSKYRDRREKIQQQQSKSLDDLQFYRDGNLKINYIYCYNTNALKQPDSNKVAKVLFQDFLFHWHQSNLIWLKILSLKGTLSATAESFVEAAARQRLLQRDQQRLRDSSSPRWKEHYALVSSKWGSMATTSTTSGFTTCTNPPLTESLLNT